MNQSTLEADTFPGEYQDRRHLTKIDCSKAIWILATNALDTTIQDFCASNHTELFVNDDESQKMQLMKRLSKEIKEDFLSKFDVSVPPQSPANHANTFSTVPYHRPHLSLHSIPTLLTRRTSRNHPQIPPRTRPASTISHQPLTRTERTTAGERPPSNPTRCVSLSYLS